MIALRCSSAFPDMRSLAEASGGLGDVLLLSPKAVRTGFELEAAFRLARGALERGENISPKLKNEALLFLARKTDFESALRKVGAASQDDFVLVCEGKLPLAKLKKRLLLTRCQQLSLSRMGRKRLGYFEGELAVEKMATARIRN